MRITEDKLPILESLEFSVVEIWREHQEMTDYTALVAYEAVHRFYREEKRGHVPKLPKLYDLDAIAFESLRTMCEFQLGRDPTLLGPIPLSLGEEPPPPVPLETLLDCLHELIKSVKRHTEFDGRQGYLTFIDEFLP